VFTLTAPKNKKSPEEQVFIVVSSVRLGEEPDDGHDHHDHGDESGEGVEEGTVLLGSGNEPIEVLVLGHESSDDLTWQPWVFSFIAVLLMGVVSVIGALFLGQTNAERYTKEFAAVSIGTLVGGACLAIFPETEEVVGFGVDVSATMLCGIMFGFVLETFIHEHHHKQMSVIDDDCATHKHVQDSDPNVKDVVVSKCTTITVKNVRIHIDKFQPVEENHNDPNRVVKQVDVVPIASEIAEAVVAASASLPSGKDADAKHKENAGDDELAQKEDAASKRKSKLIEPIVYMILSGDGLHSFVDGAVIGASFLNGTYTGILLTLAILAHELPQELGDLAVMLHSGLPLKKALMANFLCQMIALPGAFLAVLVGSQVGTATVYFLPFAGGLFLYLALGSLMPLVVKNGVRPIHMALIALGIGIMGLLTLLPHSH
jgi:zinc transporter ZupT